jgi:hypothetical protein
MWCWLVLQAGNFIALLRSVKAEERVAVVSGRGHTFTNLLFAIPLNDSP